MVILEVSVQGHLAQLLIMAVGVCGGGGWSPHEARKQRE
jgi:hypothetical protein